MNETVPRLDVVSDNGRRIKGFSLAIKQGSFSSCINTWLQSTAVSVPSCYPLGPLHPPPPQASPCVVVYVARGHVDVSTTHAVIQIDGGVKLDRQVFLRAKCAPSPVRKKSRGPLRPKEVTDLRQVRTCRLTTDSTVIALPIAPQKPICRLRRAGFIWTFDWCFILAFPLL